MWSVPLVSVGKLRRALLKGKPRVQVFVPGLYPSLDLPDAAALHAPGALLVQQCRRDALYPMSGMQAAVDKLTRIYAKAGIPERFRGTFYDDTHSFRPAMQEEAFDWLDRWLA